MLKGINLGFKLISKNHTGHKEIIFKRLNPSQTKIFQNIQDGVIIIKRNINLPSSIKSKEDYKYFDGRKTLFTRIQEDQRIQILLVIGILVLIVIIIIHIDQVPITGRRRLLLWSQESEKEIGEAAYKQMLEQYKDKLLPQNSRHVIAVKRVGERIVQNSGFDELKKLNWEFNVVESPITNALVLPGGKVLVFTGILPIMKNEEGMATVLGHEIGHTLARHIAERNQFGGILSFFSTFAALVLHLSMFYPRLAGQMLNLRHSRSKESEADHIGMILMARACYDPSKAPELWKNFAKTEEHKQVRFLSTHPTHEDRLVQMSGWMYEAKSEYSSRDCGYKNPQSNLK